MEKGAIQVYCGNGRGKTTAALGQAIQMASRGKTVVIIQFLKERNESEISFISRLEPEIKLFRFEKGAGYFANLSDEEKKDEIQNIKNGLNFAKKVLVTEECDMLILDEILGLLDHEIVTEEDIKVLFEAKNESTEIIVTGTNSNDAINSMADYVYCIHPMKQDQMHEGGE